MDRRHITESKAEGCDDSFLLAVSTFRSVCEQSYVIRTTHEASCNTGRLLLNYWVLIFRTVNILCAPITLRQGHRLRELVNRALRRMFGPKREEVAGS